MGKNFEELTKSELCETNGGFGPATPILVVAVGIICWNKGYKEGRKSK